MTDFEVDRNIKLEGTNYDRRRKLTVQDVAKIRRDYCKGVSICALAKAHNVSYITIKYHVDDEFRERFNKERNQYAHSYQDQYAARIERVAYKRSIVSKG